MPIGGPTTIFGFSGHFRPSPAMWTWAQNPKNHPKMQKITFFGFSSISQMWPEISFLAGKWHFRDLRRPRNDYIADLGPLRHFSKKSKKSPF